MEARWKLAAFAAAILVLDSGASAAEVAFYPFSEGNAGANAIGVALHNAVDPSSLSGTAVHNSEDAAATATFLDDVPGRYLYTNKIWRADAVYSTNAFRSIQVSWETNWNAQITSATSIEFADLGARLAALDAWTVEFFFKFDVLRMTNKGAYQSYQYNVRFGEDERIFASLQNQPDGNGRGYSVRAFYGGVAGNASIARLDKGDGIVPGMWHHMAVTYDGGTRKIKAIVDYAHSGDGRQCTNDTSSAVLEAFSLGNGLTAGRFAALRVTDRVLSSRELLRASDIPPDDAALQTSFHWTFESNATGAPLGTVPNEAPWRVRYGAPVTNQYAYAVDGQIFRSSGDGVVTPTTFAYTDESIGTLTLDGFASNVTDLARSGLLLPSGDMRPNTNCAVLVVGPKNASSEYFGKGPSFLMGDVDLLTASDFTAEMYWRPDIDGWKAVLGTDPRTRASLFGVSGAFKNGVSGSIITQYAWDLYMDIKASSFTFNVIVGPVDGAYQQKAYAVPGMKTSYLEKCVNEHLQHYAVVYRVADAANNGNPTVRFFIGHEECETLTLPAPIVDFPACFKDGMAFSVGNNLNDPPMQGWFDEIRYTERALPPSEFLFLKRYAPRGIILILR